MYVYLLFVDVWMCVVLLSGLRAALRSALDVISALGGNSNSSSFILRPGNRQQAKQEKQSEICIHPLEFLHPVEIYRYPRTEATVER